MSYSGAPSSPNTQWLYIAHPFDNDILNDLTLRESLRCYVYAQNYSGIVMYQMNNWVSSGTLSDANAWASFISYFNSVGINVAAAFGGLNTGNAILNYNATRLLASEKFYAIVSEIEWWNYSYNLPFQAQDSSGTYSFYDALQIIYLLRNSPNIGTTKIFAYIGWTKGYDRNTFTIEKTEYESGFPVISIDVAADAFTIKGNFTSTGITNGKMYEVGQQMIVKDYPAVGTNSTFTISSISNAAGNTKIGVTTNITSAFIGDDTKILTSYDIVGAYQPTFPFLNGGSIRVKGDKRFRFQNPLLPVGSASRAYALKIFGSVSNDGVYYCLANAVTYNVVTDQTEIPINLSTPIPANDPSGFVNLDVVDLLASGSVAGLGLNYPVTGSELQQLYNIVDEFWLHDYVAETPKYSYVQTRSRELAEGGDYLNSTFSVFEQKDVSFIVSTEGYYKVLSANVANQTFTLEYDETENLTVGGNIWVNNYPTTGTTTKYLIASKAAVSGTTIVGVTPYTIGVTTAVLPTGCQAINSDNFSKRFFEGKNTLNNVVYSRKNPIDAYKYIVTPIAAGSPTQASTPAQSETNADINTYLNINGIVIFKDSRIKPYNIGDGPNILITVPQSYYNIINNGGGTQLVDVNYCDDCLPLGGTWSYTWSVSGPSLPSLTSYSGNSQACNGTISTTLIYNGPGTYLIDITVSDGFVNSSETITVQVTPRAAFTITSELKNPIACANDPWGQANITISGGYSPTMTVTITDQTGNLVWTGGGYSTQTIQTPAIYFGSGAGIYTVTCTDASGTSASTTLTVTTPAPITGTFASVDTDCSGNNGSLTVTPSGGTPGYTYLWDNDPSLTNNYISGAYGTPGAHIVVVTDSKGCSEKLTGYIQGPDPWLVTARTVDPQCFNSSTGAINIQSVSGGFGGPYTYSWSHAPGLNSPQATNLPQGIYVCTITDVNGCTETAGFFLTAQYPDVSFEIDGPNVACNTSVKTTFDAINVIGTAPISYQWSNGDTGPSADYSFLGQSPGFTTISCTMTDAHGCQYTDTFTVTITNWGYVPVLSVVGTPLTSCTGSQAVITVDNPLGFPGYWNINGSPTSYSITVDKAWFDQYSPGTAYNFIWTASNLLNGCEASASILVEPPTEITLLVDAITPNPCGGPGNIGAIDVSVINGCPPYTYSWSAPNVPGFVDPGTQDISGLLDGEYFITVTDSNSPTPNEATLGPLVVVTEVLNVTGSVQASGCTGPGSIITDVTGGTAPYQYIWSNGEDTANIYNLTPGTYTVTVIDFYGCTDTETFVVVNGDITTLALDYATNPIVGGDGEIQFFVTNSITGVVDITVEDQNNTLWLDDSYNLFQNNTATFNVNNLPVGTYTITVVNQFGCEEVIVLTLSQTIPDIVDETDASITGIMCCIGKKIAEMFKIYSYGHANIDCLAIPLITMNSMLKSVRCWYPSNNDCFGGSRPYQIISGNWGNFNYPNQAYFSIPDPFDNGGQPVFITWQPQFANSVIDKMLGLGNLFQAYGYDWEIQGDNLFVYWPHNTCDLNGIRFYLTCVDQNGNPIRGIVIRTTNGFIGGEDECCPSDIGTSVCLSEDEASAMLNQLKCSC